MNGSLAQIVVDKVFEWTYQLLEMTKTHFSSNIGTVLPRLSGLQLSAPSHIIRKLELSLFW